MVDSVLPSHYIYSERFWKLYHISFFLLTVCLDKFDEFLQRRITFCPDKENTIDVTEPKDAVGCFKVTKHFAFKFSHKQAGKVDSHRSTHFCSINLITYLETNERVLRYILKQVKWVKEKIEKEEQSLHIDQVIFIACRLFLLHDQCLGTGNLHPHEFSIYYM